MALQELTAAKLHLDRAVDCFTKAIIIIQNDEAHHDDMTHLKAYEDIGATVDLFITLSGYLPRELREQVHRIIEINVLNHQSIDSKQMIGYLRQYTPSPALIDQPIPPPHDMAWTIDMFHSAMILHTKHHDRKRLKIADLVTGLNALYPKRHALKDADVKPWLNHLGYIMTAKLIAQCIFTTPMS